MSEEKLIKNNKYWQEKNNGYCFFNKFTSGVDICTGIGWRCRVSKVSVGIRYHKKNKKILVSSVQYRKIVPIPNLWFTFTTN